MALAPRCAVAAHDSNGAASFSLALTGWTNLGGPAGTAPQAGDLVLVTGTLGSGTLTGNTWSQTAGTGTWTFQDTGTLVASTISAFTAWRIFDGTETAPTFTASVGGSHRVYHSAIAITPDAGNTVSIDKWAALKTASSGTSFTPNSAAAAGTGEVSVLLNILLAAANGSTAITLTTSSGWTAGASESTAGTGSTRSDYAENDYKTGVSGTVAPGAETANISCVAYIQHVLAQQAASAAPGAAVSQPPLRVPPRRPGRAITGRTPFRPAVPALPARQPPLRIPPLRQRRAVVLFTLFTPASPVPAPPGQPVRQSPLRLLPRRQRRAVVLFTPAVAASPVPAPPGAEGGPVYYPYHHRGRGRTR